MKPDKLSTLLADRNLSAVARGAQVNYRSVIRMRNGEADKLKHETVRRVMDYLQEQHQHGRPD